MAHEDHEHPQLTTLQDELDELSVVVVDRFKKLDRDHERAKHDAPVKDHTHVIRDITKLKPYLEKLHNHAQLAVDALQQTKANVEDLATRVGSLTNQVRHLEENGRC